MTAVKLKLEDRRRKIEIIPPLPTREVRFVNAGNNQSLGEERLVLVTSS